MSCAGRKLTAEVKLPSSKRRSLLLKLAPKQCVEAVIENVEEVVEETAEAIADEIPAEAVAEEA
jgi:hypothetical protein